MSFSASVVLVAAPPTLQRQGLLATLQAQRPDLTVLATADAYALPGRLLRQLPDLLILDARLPGLTLPGLLQQLHQARPQQRLLVLGSRRLPPPLCAWLSLMRASTLPAHQTTPAQLVACIEELLTAGPLPRPLPVRQASAGLPEALSPREWEILHLVSRDYSTLEIAASLCISVRTVDTHRRTLLQKTGARSSVGLVLHAVRQGWIEVG